MFKDYDSPIANDDPPQQEILPAGEYWFSVTLHERGRTKAGDAPMSTLALNVDNRTTAIHRLTIKPSCEWSVAAFFRCVGLKKHGEAASAGVWDALQGQFGRAKFRPKTFNNRTSMEIESCIDFDTTATPPEWVHVDPAEEGDIPF